MGDDVVVSASKGSGFTPVSLRVKAFRQDQSSSSRGGGEDDSTFIGIGRRAARLSFNSQSSDGDEHHDARSPAPAAAANVSMGKQYEAAAAKKAAPVPVPLTPGGYDSDDAKLFGAAGKANRLGGRVNEAMDKPSEAAAAPLPAAMRDDDDDVDWVFRKKR